LGISELQSLEDIQVRLIQDVGVTEVMEAPSLVWISSLFASGKGDGMSGPDF
jgi:hypothetical protein